MCGLCVSLCVVDVCCDECGVGDVVVFVIVMLVVLTCN